MGGEPNAKEEAARRELETYVKDCKIFIDTCSLLHSGSYNFWANIIPLLYQYDKKVFIPYRCIEELWKHGDNQEKPELAEKAKDSWKKLEPLIGEFVEIRGEPSDSFADNVFLAVFTKFRIQYKLLLITQDNNLAKDIEALNNSKAVIAKPVTVKRLNKYGYLSSFNWNINDSEKNTKFTQHTSKSENDIDEDEMFRISKTVTSIDNSIIPVHSVPGEGDTVKVKGGAVRLITRIAGGGEGDIYKTDTPYVAKIYKKENITQRKYKKIELMLSKNIKCDGICYPVAAIYNKQSEFVGYLMPKAKGIEIQRSIFIKPRFQKLFPGWKKRDTVELCITILEKIKYLHDRNIIMGDINPANILVVSTKEVYFVDTDSYQIEDFPCPVGTINYTAPEIQQKHFESFLRTIGNENFAVATLLFMIMLPGKPPYSQQGGENPVRNIIEMDFSYPLGDNSNRKTPDGPWRYIWSHLTYDLKAAFYNTFRKEGEHSSENNRLSVDEWLSIFIYYLELLDSGKYGRQDKMSEELFPTRHKKNPNVEYIVCKLCNNEAPENQCINGICKACLDKGEEYKCKKCGKPMLYTNYQKYIKKSQKYEVCSECYEKGFQTRLTQRCVECGEYFDITNNDYDFYMSKGLAIPKRCKSCRDAKKNRGNSNFSGTSSFLGAEDISKIESTISSSRPRPKSSSRGSWCFITTAVCEYYGLDDDSTEMRTMRKFRDEWLKNQPDGISLLTEYYNTAPLIVSKLKRSNQYAMYCKELWNKYLSKCLDLIEQKKYMECKNLYVSMVRYMQKQFT